MYLSLLLKISICYGIFDISSYIILKLELENKMENSCHCGRFVLCGFWVANKVWQPYGMV